MKINKMTKRDFFIIVIKLFGLYSLIASVFSLLPSSISFALMDIDLFSAILIIVVVLIITGLFVLLIFYSDKIVNLLKLDKGFDDDRIEIGNINNIVKFAVIVIGGLLIIDNIPEFLSHTLYAFKINISGNNYGTVNKFNWVVSGINIVLGLLLITNYNAVSKILRIKGKND